eukprot:GHVS01071835.1.p1 GENE.GHVS01071835.1~~GHVS01071835.1.p1  ORF type:complete len:194 (+),score=18.25 GHVS01071835.1:46-582(+)
MEAAGPQHFKRRAKGKKVNRSQEEFKRTGVAAVSPDSESDLVLKGFDERDFSLTAEEVKLIREAARRTRNFWLSHKQLSVGRRTSPLLSQPESVPSGNIAVLAVLGFGAIFFLFAILIFLVRRSNIRAKRLKYLKAVHKARQNGLSGEEEETDLIEEHVSFNSISAPDVSISLGGDVP